MEIRVLGPLEVRRSGGPLDLGGRKQRSVLAALVLRAREVIGPERLADVIWEGEPPASADTTLRGYVSNLRKAIEPDRAAGDEPQILRTTPAGYVLDVADEAIDSRRFERLVAQGRERRAHDPAAAVESWTQGLGLWRGDPYQDFAYANFVQSESARLGELKLSCREDLFDAQLALGRHDAVVGDLEAFRSLHPTRERALRLLMLALYRCGRQADALHAYEEGRRRLDEELGVEPSAEIRLLHEQILRQEEALTVAVVPTTPSGKQTLTFLLGDVERSTEKLRTLGDDYASALDEHRRKLREAFASHGGRAIRTWGDGVFAAFDGATDAVAAAVAAQCVLSRDVDDDRRLPVRMGLDTGEATLHGGEYVGLAIHVAARIMDAAHGDQVLVSQATKELFEAEEGTEVELAGAGTHVLKDVPDPVRFFQVVHPEMRTDFPPLRTGIRSDNLPRRPTSFVGRESDLELIEATLEDARIVTLTGVGGVGKTRLAIEVGARLAPGYPDGVWLCELAPIGDAESLLHHIASTLRVDRQRGMTLHESLLTALGQRQSLVILDNCEHLLGPVADLVEAIVHSCDTTHILATSRETIGVDGERSRPVLSLGAEAIRLFEDRARAVRPDFTVDAGNEGEIAAICGKLDGIPLAIELAAARVTSLSPSQIAKRLDEGFHFLRSGRRAAVDRHRTLHGAIDWSYGMLTEAERTLFDRLSVFAGGFTLEGADEVCGRDLDIDVADGLAALVAKSMVQADVSGPEARYSLLETMRQYAQDRLAERGDAEPTLAAHARYFAELYDATIPDMPSVDIEEEASAVRTELDNLRAAHAWAVTAGETDLALRVVAATWVVFLTDDRTEPAAWAQETLGMTGVEDHLLFPVALSRAADATFEEGDRDLGRDMAARALAAIDDRDAAIRLYPLLVSARQCFFTGDRDGCVRFSDEARRVADLHGERTLSISARIFAPLIEAYSGNHEHAIALAEGVLPIAREHSSPMYACACYALGEVLAEAGSDPDRALDLLATAITLFRAHDMRFWTGVALVTSASLRARHGDPSEALMTFLDAIEQFRFRGVWMQQWTTLRNLTELFGRLGLDEPAAVLLAASETAKRAVPVFGAQAERLGALAEDLRGRLGDDVFRAATERGRALSDEEAVALAKTEIDRALELTRSGSSR
ncbi:MAG: BTAD domain-containing putative transcriptional regulator [Actinomycetota bacterium]